MTDAKRLLDDLARRLTAAGMADAVSFGTPVSAEEVAQAEAALALALPPSYVEFVTRHGPFTIDGRATGQGEGHETALFPPAELVAQTEHYRAELREFGDEESVEIIEDALLVCGDPVDEYFHLFVPSSRDERGEMAVHEYDYQDPANTEPWSPGLGHPTFTAFVEALVGRIAGRLRARR